MVAEWKQEAVNELAKKIKEYDVVGIVSISDIPSRQFQVMRRTLGEDVEIHVTRNNLIKRALEKTETTQLEEYVDGPSGIILTNLNPFKLQNILRQSETNAPAKKGSIAPYDIVIPKGDTSFPAGPIIGELQEAGIKAKIEGGKIVVKTDSKVVSEGEAISGKLASVLTRLGIEPITIALHMTAAYGNGRLYTNEVLSVDQAQVLGKLASAHASAFNLAYNAGIPTRDTVKLLVSKAALSALNLSLKAEIVNAKTIDQLLAKAGAHMKALLALIPEDALKTGGKEVAPVDEASKDVVKEAPNEKKEEAPVEDAPTDVVKEAAKKKGGKEAASEGEAPVEEPQEKEAGTIVEEASE